MKPPSAAPSRHRQSPLLLSVAAAVATLLAGSGLAPLFDGNSWIPPVLLGVGCVVVGANLSRLAGLPPWMSAPTALLALLVGLIVLYSGGHTALGIIPTPGAITALRGRFADGVADIAGSSVPMQPQPGLVALVVAGVGGLTILVELCAVTLRRAAVAGYPLLILAAVPMITVESDLPWWTFTAGALGYVLLLAAAHADATTHWGSQIPHHGNTPASKAPVKPAYLVGLGGIIVAIVVSALVPGSSGQGVFTGLDALEDFGADKGRSVQTVHPFTSLRGELNQADPTELLRVRTDDPEPFYLRLTSLDRFVDEGWSQSRLRAGNDGKVSDWENRFRSETLLDGDVPRIQQQTEIEVRGLRDSSYLPVYANPTEVSVSGDWRWDSNTETVFSARDRTAGRSYTSTSQRVPYSRELLAAAPPVSRTSRLFQQYTALDGKVRSEVNRLVRELVPAGGGQIDTVRAIEEHFDESNGFRYTERTTAGSSGDALVDFLDNKQGFCEQYASAMAYLVRVAGIPARVAVGYSRGTEVGDYISINSRDAHAWVEVYFRGLGWVPFDPTPAAGPGRTVNTSFAQESPTDGLASASPAVPGAAVSPDGSVATPTPGTSVPNPNTEPETQSSSWAQRWPTLLGLGTLALLGATLLVGPAAFRSWERRRRLRRIRGANSEADDSDAADAAWQEFTDTAYDLRLFGSLPTNRTRGLHGTSNLNETSNVNGTGSATGWRSRHTPREISAQLQTRQLDERGQNAIALIVAAQERSRYARDAGTARGLYAAVRRAEVALAAQVGIAGRLLATVWPLSVTERMVHTGFDRLMRWQTVLARSAANVTQGLRHMVERVTGSTSSSRPHHAGDANVAPADRSVSSGRKTHR